MARIWNKHKQIHHIRKRGFFNVAGTLLKPHTSSLPHHSHEEQQAVYVVDVAGYGALRCRRKVFVGLSGGVDSSVSAALLKKQGYDVTGVFIRVWNPVSARPDLSPDLRSDLFGACQASDDRLDAMRVCAKLQIPFVELNLEKEYKREVVDYMIREYKAGKTPNPDVFCNRFIKFGGFYKWAMKKGADFIATGHYARVEPLTINYSLLTKEKNVKGQELRVKSLGLFAGSDPKKDQSYFLWQIRKEQLPRILFPVGGKQKPEVRKLAKKFGLITADKKDSQGLCFIGKIDVKDFLAHYINPKKGKILDEKGENIGNHNGAFFYTIGERIGNTEAARKGEHGSGTEHSPYYVIAKNIRANTLIVSHKAPDQSLPNSVHKVVLHSCNWLCDAKTGKIYFARARYRQPLEKCRLAAVSKNTATVIFSKPQSFVAPGQSLVIYDMGLVVGGGIIN